jgi:hypothetical protein
MTEQKLEPRLRLARASLRFLVFCERVLTRVRALAILFIIAFLPSLPMSNVSDVCFTTT